MRNKLIALLTLLTSSSVAFALAGFAERFYEYQAWIFPAYLYNLIFGVIFAVILTAFFFILRKSLNRTLSRVCKYLESHSSIAIVSVGILFSIPLGILCITLYHLLWLIAKIPILGLMLIYPLALLHKRYRNSILRLHKILRIAIIIAISAMLASVCFIVFTKLGWLSHTNATYSNPYDNFKILTHPFESIKSIWSGPLFFMCETVFSLILLWIGKGLSAVACQLLKIHLINRLWQTLIAYYNKIVNLSYLIGALGHKFKWVLIGIAICGYIMLILVDILKRYC